RVYQKYRLQTGDLTKTVINATASPFKFSRSVLKAIKGPDYLQGRSEFDILRELGMISNISLHPAVKDLQNKDVLHRTICQKEEIRLEIKKILGVF
ncbi:MAG: threonine synthase, partial [Firmicutes bacterium]|nr:threonine synthase [Bacillota bacterium]